MENDSNYENTEMFLPSQFGWLPYRLYSYARGMGGVRNQNDATSVPDVVTGKSNVCITPLPFVYCNQPQ